MSPYNEVMSKYKRGKLHSGSKTGPKVRSRKQAIAIMLSEKRAASGGKAEYRASSRRSSARKTASRRTRKRGRR